MPRITRVTTRTGDAGDTALATGRRVRKDHPRIEAYGTVDELSAALGVVLAGGLEDSLAQPLARIQNQLFHLGAQLATPSEEGEEAAGPRLDDRHVEALERWQDELLEELPPLENFVLPGGSPAAARLHVARTVCRRAERRVVDLASQESVPPEVVRFLNRLSDLLFTLSRTVNHRAGVEQPVWDSRA